MTDYLNLVKPWIAGPRRELLRTRMFTVHSRHNSSAVDRARNGEFVQIECPDWVNVIAVTPGPVRHVVMIEQYRHGLDTVTLEIPGGIAEPGEDPAAAGARELVEEAGYRGLACEVIGRISANPALQTNWVHTCLVRDAAPEAAIHLDEHEEIGIRLVPLDEIPGLIKEGIIHHAFVVAAFMHSALARI